MIKVCNNATSHMFTVRIYC